jgi:hypothetical protein
MASEFHTEGLQFLLEVSFSEGQSVPTNFYIGLATNASLAEDASLASITEVSGSGYARQAVASNATDFTSAAAGTNDRKITTKIVTFSATGTWTGAATVFLATSLDNSGKLIASNQLSVVRTLYSGDTLGVSVELDLVG